MDATHQWILGGGLTATLALIGLGFAAMSTNPPFTVPKWLPKIFFTLAIAILAGECIYFWDIHIAPKIIGVFSLLGLVIYLFWSLLKRVFIKNKSLISIENKIEITKQNVNLSDTLTNMHRRLVELQSEKFMNTKISYDQFRKAMPSLADKMGLVKLDEWYKYNRKLKSRIQRALPPRPIIRGSIRQRFAKWVEYKERIHSIELSELIKIKTELINSKKWAWEDGIKISDWMDDHQWGIRELRDADYQWKAYSESISHYFKADNTLRELINKHIEISRLYNNTCLMNRYCKAQKMPKDSFLIILRDELAGSSISPIQSEIYLAEILSDISNQLSIIDKKSQKFSNSNVTLLPIIDAKLNADILRGIFIEVTNKGSAGAFYGQIEILKTNDPHIEVLWGQSAYNSYWDSDTIKDITIPSGMTKRIKLVTFEQSSHINTGWLRLYQIKDKGIVTIDSTSYQVFNPQLFLIAEVIFKVIISSVPTAQNGIKEFILSVSANGEVIENPKI